VRASKLHDGDFFPGDAAVILGVLRHRWRTGERGKPLDGAIGCAVVDAVVRVPAPRVPLM